MAVGRRTRGARRVALGGALCCVAATLAPADAGSSFVAGASQRWAAPGAAHARALELSPLTRQVFGGGGGRPGGAQTGGGGGPGGFEEPPWLGTFFFGAIILSFIPGPWQVILSPIISIINAFYMFKFGIFLLGIAAIFGLNWYFENSTLEGQCPNCGAMQRGPKGEPFGCGFCGQVLETKDDKFIPYFKSGEAEKTAFEQMQEAAKKAATTAKESVAEATGSSSTTATAKTSGKPGKKPAQVVDVEVL